MNFRRVIAALALVVLFVGLASAQSQTKPPITCTVTAATAPTLRTEGIAEKVGDVVLTCGMNATLAPPTAGNPAQRFDITVDFGVPITSRQDAAQFAADGNGNGIYATEMLLLFNDPGLNNGPVPGYGQNAAATICTAANAFADRTTIRTGANTLAAIANCPATYLQSNGIWVLNNGGVQAANAYQGAINNVASPTKVTFYDVPFVNSADATVTNTYRLVNARVTPGSGDITATVSNAVSANTAAALAQYNMSLTTAETPKVGGVATGFAMTVQTTGISSCAATGLNPALGSGQNRAYVALLRFQENFNNASKTRVLPINNAAGNAQGGDANNQISPTGSYRISNSLTLTTANSESGYVLPGVNVGGANIGLADFGTRFEAIFKGLDKNVTYYISRTNVTDPANATTIPTNIGGRDSNNGLTYAVALPQTGLPAGTTMENQPYAAAAAGLATFGGYDAVQIVPDNSGNAKVVWEVTNAIHNAADVYNFAVFAVFNPTVKAPTLGNGATVQLAVVPVGSTTELHIPRFAATTFTATGFSNILSCQTSLMFPFVTNQAGFETGIAIANTGADPFQTTAAAAGGTCAVNFYGTNAPTSAVTTAAIAPGQTYANTVGGMGVLNFQGYSIAVCNFQFGHGFAFIQGGTGSSQMAMGYLALVMTTSTGGTRGQSLLGETFTQ